MQEEAQGLLDRAEGAEGSAKDLKGEVASLSAALLIKEDQLSFQAGKLNEMGTINTTLASVQKQLQTLQKSLQVTSHNLFPCPGKHFAVGVQSASLLLFFLVVSVGQTRRGDLHTSCHWT